MDCSCIKINVDPFVIISSIPSLLGKGARYLAGFGKSNTDTLVDEARSLAFTDHDLKKAVDAAETLERKKRRQEVERWMNDVVDILNDVRVFKDSRIFRIPCVRDCPCWATDMLKRVRNLKMEGEDLLKGKMLLGEEPLPSIYVPNPNLVGGEESLKEVLEKRATIRLMGIHGMSGIGKTALLQRIYHVLKAQREHVIYAVVSKEVNILKLQKVIGEQLGLCLTDERPRDGLSPESERAATLLVKLRDSSVTLLLDDVWELLQWEDIGIPSPVEHRDGIKIIFTTPFHHICESMGVGQGTIKVSFLNDEQSWNLFCLKMNGRADGRADAYYRQMISQCGGLPRAIITFFDYIDLNRRFEMEQKRDHLLYDIKLIKDTVLFPLKCIIDELEKKSTHEMEERIREMMQCLLYCSLFPEDRSIHVDQLIDYWFGEGFLDCNCDSTLLEAREKGYELIRTLVKECFLHSIRMSDDRQVKLHGMIRCMASWLTNGESQPSRLFLTSTRLKYSTNKGWEKAQRVSSMGGGVKKIPHNLERCPNLLTLLFNNHNIDHLYNQSSHDNIVTERGTIKGRPEVLFRIAGTLKVLDLSGTKIDRLPREIGLMNQVQYLNLSYTKIKSLPNEMSKLKYLRQLKLRGTSHLSNVPVKSIPPSILQMFDLLGSVYTWQPKYKLLWPLQLNLEHFSEDTWNYLTEFGLTITSLSDLLKLSKSEKLSGCTVFLELSDVAKLTKDHLSSVFRCMVILRELFISGVELTELALITGTARKLEILKLCNLSSLSTIEVIEEAGLLLNSLRHLHISDCPQLTHISWVHQLSNLREIEMTNCPRVHLINLTNLRWITCGRFKSPSLEVLSVSNCPNFRHLSFDIDTAAKIRKISGERQWWESLQWDEDGDTKSTLQSRFTEDLAMK